ncbi:MAG: carotenoid biosynthesis protein [Ktedonobacteraceae bacterium]|nr:carotenoid biosynthesis protein [Ktedonobacteraceae bacterium]
MQTFLRYLFLALFGLFCFAYPFAVIGVAFDVKPPFSLDWAGSALLFLEGTLLVVDAMLLHNRWRALGAGLCVTFLSYGVETLGVTTGFPFGRYRYTGILFPALPGGVPLAVMFAWILVVFGSYGIVMKRGTIFRLKDALLAAALAALLDLAIEPVAAYIEHYWQWLEPGRLSYYGVPLANFVSWFAVALVLLLLVGRLLSQGDPSKVLQREEIEKKYIQKRRSVWLLVSLTPRILFSCSFFMFGLVDLTHGYYWATLPALLAGAIIYLCR